MKTWRTDKAATELSQLILAPVKDKLSTKRLVIVADGALQYIPFAALADLTPQPSSVKGKEGKDKDKREQCDFVRSDKKSAIAKNYIRVLGDFIYK
ncbi:CHAT domain-containing protein [Nostoc sp.]|uniref:CHAT domain-containing protein n=1 Tax=Nostoc sp. TaxID=1180 RepID=UPI0021576CBF